MKSLFPKGDLEMKSAYLKGRIGSAILLSVIFAVGCATTGPPLFGAKGESPGLMPAGSSYVVERRDSGSFGSGTYLLTFKALGIQTWQGRKVSTSDSPEGTLLLDATSTKWVAFVKGTTPLVSWDPPLGYEFPLWVGKTWTQAYLITNHVSGKTTTAEIRWNVEAREEIKVPAGTFMAWRISNTDPTTESITWWSQELGVFVKSKSQRNAKHPMGPGLREAELYSHNIKR